MYNFHTDPLRETENTYYTNCRKEILYENCKKFLIFITDSSQLQSWTLIMETSDKCTNIFKMIVKQKAVYFVPELGHTIPIIFKELEK